MTLCDGLENIARQIRIRVTSGFLDLADAVEIDLPFGSTERHGIPELSFAGPDEIERRHPDRIQILADPFPQRVLQTEILEFVVTVFIDPIFVLLG